MFQKFIALFDRYRGEVHFVRLTPQETAELITKTMGFGRIQKLSKEELEKLYPREEK